MFNNTSVYLGNWKAVRNFAPVGDGKWHLFNITADFGENNDLESQHKEILNKLISNYDKFATDVGVLIPTGNVETFQTVGERSD